MKNVIVGAGPSGLYTAIKLRQAGILDVVIYDPRANNYTRPGHLELKAFQAAQEGITQKIWHANKHGHIKDLERALYAEAIKLGIRIENKAFVGVYQDEQRPGVIVSSDGVEERVEANYVFDCTGAKRAVVSAINLLDSNSNFQLSTMTDLPVSHHFLAYIKIKQKDMIKFVVNFARFYDQPEKIDSVSYIQSIIKLRALGWKEFKIPRCYLQPFGDEKMCFYMHAPEHLEPKDYETWVQTVLQSYVPKMSYTRLDNPVKPRFQAFRSHAQVLQEFSYKGKNLPTTIALGDAQIDSDYALAHGIYNGIARIDSLFRHLNVLNGEIAHFDSENYKKEVNSHLMSHKKGIILQAERQKSSFTLALDVAESKFRQVLQLKPEGINTDEVSELLNEVIARQKNKKVKQLITERLLSTEQHFQLTADELYDKLFDALFYAKLTISYFANHITDEAKEEAYSMLEAFNQCHVDELTQTVQDEVYSLVLESISTHLKNLLGLKTMSEANELVAMLSAVAKEHQSKFKGGALILINALLSNVQQYMATRAKCSVEAGDSASSQQSHDGDRPVLTHSLDVFGVFSTLSENRPNESKPSAAPNPME